MPNDTWTAPADWAASEKPLSSTKLNQQLRDNLYALWLAITSGSTAVTPGDERVASRNLAPTIVEQRCTANVTTSGGTTVDVTGATITLTPAIASMAIVWGVFDIENGVAGDVYLGTCVADAGPAEGATMVHKAAANTRVTIGNIWVIPLTAASHTIKLQIARASGSGTATVRANNSKLVLWLVGDANVTNDVSS